MKWLGVVVLVAACSAKRAPKIDPAWHCFVVDPKFPSERTHLKFRFIEDRLESAVVESDSLDVVHAGRSVLRWNGRDYTPVKESWPPHHAMVDKVDGSHTVVFTPRNVGSVEYSYELGAGGSTMKLVTTRYEDTTRKPSDVEIHYYVAAACDVVDAALASVPPPRQGE